MLKRVSLRKRKRRCAAALCPPPPCGSKAPDAGGKGSGSDDDEEAMKFNAKTQAQLLKEPIGWCDLLEAWIACLLAGNTAANHEAACTLGALRAPCCSHLLSLEVNEMVKSDGIMREMSKAAHKTMVKAKQSLKSRTIACKLANSPLSPTASSKARWPRVFDHMRKIYQVCDCNSPLTC